MNLYYANLKANKLAKNARKNKYARYALSDFLYECDMQGYEIYTDRNTGEITISERKEGNLYETE